MIDWNAGGPPTLGIAPLLVGLLSSMAPGLLSKLFGGDPQAKLRKQIMALLNSQGGLTNKFYQQALGSPAFAQGQGLIAAGANQAGATLGREMGARGIGTSGSGAVLSSLIPSLVGSQQAGLRTSAYQGAQGQAQNTIQQQIAALTGTSGPSQSSQLFGTGIDAFGKLLQDWFKSRQPAGGGWDPNVRAY